MIIHINNNNNKNNNMPLLYYIVKHSFYIPPILVVWRRTTSQTAALATDWNVKSGRKSKPCTASCNAALGLKQNPIYTTS
jgi:hypothetical protein